MKKNTFYRYLLFFLVAFLPKEYCLGQTGSLDLTFNPNDVGFGSGRGAYFCCVYTTSIQNDGKIIIGGNFISYNGIGRNSIARLNADGSLDTTFIPGTGANGTVSTTAIQSDGKIIIGGDFTTYNGTSRNRIARLNADGTLDGSFNPGSGAQGSLNTSVNSISIQSDGKIIIGGEFTTYNGTGRNRVARLNSDGSLDNSFNPGTGANSNVNSISIQNDGKIIIGGWFTTYNGTGRNRVARLNSDGTLDASFNPGTGPQNRVHTITIQSDGKIIIGGNFTSYNGTGRNRIARLNVDGTLDASFSPGTGANGLVRTSSIQSDGKIIIGGEFTSYNGIVRNYIARLNADGSIDASFNSGTEVSSWVFTTSIQSDGKLIIGGEFEFLNGTGSNRIARLNADGSHDAFFNPKTGANSQVSTTAIQSDGKIIIGGDFTSFNGTWRNRIARLNADGSVDASFNPGTGATQIVYSISIQSDGKIIIGGDFTNYNWTGRNRIARLNVDGTLDTSFNPGTGANDTVYTTAIQSDGKIIIGGNFTSYNGTGKNRIARLNADGTLDASFNPGTGANSTVRTTSIQSDGKIIIGGTFTSYNGTGISRIARLNADGSLDATFNLGTGTNGTVLTTAIQSDGKIIIGGNFTTYNGTSINRIARLNADGTLDATFNPGSGVQGGFNSTINSISIQSDGKIIIGGDFTSYNGIGRNNIARLNADGSLDAFFNSGSGANNFVYSTAIQSDGKIIIGGWFTSYNGIGRNRIARTLNNGIVFGKLYLDFNENCTQESNENLLNQNFTISIEPGKHTVQAQNGFWVLDTLPSGDYTATIDTTNTNWRLTCPPSQTFTVVHPDSVTIGPSFGFVSNFPCPAPNVSIAMPRMRRGFGNQIISVKACNKNTATDSIPDAYVEVQLDENISVQSVSLPHTDLGNNLFRVDVGTLYPGNCMNIYFTTTVELTAITNQTLCMEAQLYPQTDCVFDSVPSPFLPPNITISPCDLPWDGSSIQVRGICIGDSVRFEVYNNGGIGIGDMQCFSPVRLYIDGQLVFMDSIKLDGGESFVYQFLGTGQTFRLEVDNHPLHPGKSYPNASVELCGSGNWTPGIIGSMPQNDADPIIDIFCGQVSAPYDPNDKTGFPMGVGEINKIRNNQSIEYLIRFQNIGTDTAVNVVIQDTLSENFNIFTVESGVSSFPYEFSIKGQRLLEWRFNNIMLPDSTTDEPGSNGFVTFKVNQVPDLPVGTILENTANIYFDFEEAVVTNTYTHTIHDFNIIDSCNGDYELIDTTIIACDSVLVNGNMYYASQIIVDTIPYQFFCGKIQTSNIIVNQKVIRNETITACDSAEINGVWYYTSQEVTNTYLTQDECLEIITNLVISYSTTQNETITACDSAAVNGTWYYTSQEVTNTYETTQNCDSVVVTNLVINYSTTLNETITACDSVEFDGTWYYTSQEVINTYQTSQNCDSVVVTNLVINYSTTQNETITACDSAAVNGTWYYTSQEVTNTYQTAQNCDSVVITNLVINYSTTQNETITACDSAVVNGTWYYTSQEVSNTYQTTQNCDSVVVTNLVINYSTTQNETITACDSVEFNGTWYYTSQEVTNTYQTTQNCDSVFVTNIIIEKADDITIEQLGNFLQVAGGFEEYEWSYNGNILVGANSNILQAEFNGLYSVSVTDSDGCSSVATFNFIRTNIADNNLKDIVEIYPNPSSGIFMIKSLNDTELGKLIVFDVSGKEIINKKFDNNLYELDLSNYSSGVYYLSITTQKSSFIHKLIKN